MERLQSYPFEIQVILFGAVICIHNVSNRSSIIRVCIPPNFASFIEVFISELLGNFEVRLSIRDLLPINSIPKVNGIGAIVIGVIEQDLVFKRCYIKTQIFIL